MRVTGKMLANNLLRNLNQSSNRMVQIQNQMSTGSRINKPSDDPVGVETVMRLKSTLASMEQWKKNISEGLSYMQSIEGTLDGMTAMMHRLRELGVQGATGTTTPDDKRKVETEVSQIIQQFELMANTQFNGKYVFSGTRTNIETITNRQVTLNAGNYEFSWGGNGNPINIEIGPGIVIDISVSGEELFGVNPPGVGDNRTSELLTTLYKLRDALHNNDYAAINEVLGKDGDWSDPLTLSSQLEVLLRVRGDLGARTNRLETMQSQLETNLLNTRENLSIVADIDMAEAIIQYKSLQNVYQAALSVGAQIIQPSLVDFIR